MVGMRGTPGHILAATCFTGPRILSVKGGGGDTGLKEPTGLILIPGSATTSWRVFCTSGIGVPGRMRQLTLALACCASALGAWPPSSMVATQVVRSVLFQPG